MADVIVLGSGAAGLAAALGAALGGAEVVLVEKAPAYGGTTALSGGVVWMPGNRFAPEGDVPAAKRYLRELDLGDTNPALADLFVDDARRVADVIEEHTPIEWRAFDYPDYHPEFDGGRETGRAMQPAPFEASSEVALMVREGRSDAAPQHPHVQLREGAARFLTEGPALVGGLIAGCMDLGVRFVAGASVSGLRIEGGAVTGVTSDDGDIAGSVVIATGGFERNPSYVKAFLRGPMEAPIGVPEVTGDGLRMAMSVGADLGNMAEAYWGPAVRIPTGPGSALHRMLLAERSRPGSFMIDRFGRRFANEGENYNDLGRALQVFEPTVFSYARFPAWFVFDAHYRQAYGVATMRPHDPDQEWLVKADTLEGLAARMGVPADVFAATTERFNQFARTGVDEDFGRGSGYHDRFMGDHEADLPNPALGPVEEAPFYAVQVYPGCLGTRGGPRTDADGRVLRAADRTPIPGLYAAGNAAASPLGHAYPGAGGTIGPGLVFGMRAGERAARD
jgi:succinate dehydrogenase/fumarate reductase flavoprotein subunit